MMRKIMPPDEILGEVNIFSNEDLEQYSIGKSELSLEIVGDESLLYLYAEAFYYELFGESKVYIPGCLFFILVPVNFIDIKSSTTIKLKDFDQTDEKWEITKISSFYQNEHLRVINAIINIEPVKGQYIINITGDVSEYVGASWKFEFTTNFKARLTDRINRKVNYFLPEN
jgi:hypothetical protein